ncbi:hypothetical protein HPB48_016619 [Haemaphysalis longicornis]|uniref:Uncharacterized protein n=1 Tax=Haemaphysalis longicornis TaxID=44386 RepID=A0A9J6GDJ9_HAELO|nr:hypothetical protein HPB48_016619 [Haemaphysalis longicornis]
MKCNRCREYDHRVLNCPHPPTYQFSPTCSIKLNAQAEPHRCSMHCFHCGVNYPTFDNTCPVQKQQDQKSHKAAYERRKSLRNKLKTSEPGENRKSSQFLRFAQKQTSTAWQISYGRTNQSMCSSNNLPTVMTLPHYPSTTGGCKFSRNNPWHLEAQEKSVPPGTLLKPATLLPAGEPSPSLPTPASIPVSYSSQNPTPVITSHNYMQHIPDRNDPILWFLAEEISAIRQAFELMPLVICSTG